MLDKMVGIKIGQTIVILIENNHFEKVTHESVSKQPNEVIISLGVKTNDEVDELMRKVESSGGKVIDEPGTYQGYYGATFADPDGHKYNFSLLAKIKSPRKINFEGLTLYTTNFLEYCRILS